MSIKLLCHKGTNILINNANFLDFFTFERMRIKKRTTQNNSQRRQTPKRFCVIRGSNNNYSRNSRLFRAVLKMRYRLEFEQVLHMLAINECFHMGVITLAGADVAVKHSVGETEVVLITLAAEAVGGSFLYQVNG